MADLVLRGGTVVLPGEGTWRADVAVDGDRITALGLDLPRGREEVDATGLHLLPGVVDPHVHFGNTMPFADELEIDTRSALVGGVTTIGCFLRSLESYSIAMPGFVEAMRTRSAVDVFAHLQVFTSEQIEEMPSYCSEFGVTSFKFYMSGIPGIVPSVDDATMLRGMRTAAALGQGVVVAVHCETGSLVDAAREELKRDPAPGGLVAWQRAHPPYAEAIAVNTAARLAAIAGVRLYVVHVSSAEGLAEVAGLRAAGHDVIGETTSPYLCLDTTDANGLLLKMVPPIRDPEHRAALWEGLRAGVLTSIGTDNTARSRASKNPDGGVLGAMPGYAMLGVHLPALLHHACHERRLPLHALAAAISSNPARTFGLYPRKGSLLPGADADIVAVDLTRERVVDPRELGSFSDFSPFEGKRLSGWPVLTIKGGRVAAREGRLVDAAPRGRYLERRLPG